MKGMKFMSAAMLCLAGLSGTAFAQEQAFDLPQASGAYIKDYESFKLAAANETSVAVKKESAAPEIKKSEFEPSWLTGGKVHQYLGLGTIVLAGLTAATAPGEGCEQNCPPPSQRPPRDTNGTHAKLAKATVAMAAAAITTGLITHWDDFSLSDGITDPDNLHVLLGITGAALMAYAVNKSKNSAVPVSHAGIAEMGALGMVAAIKITW
jgi:hypothetical protein